MGHHFNIDHFLFYKSIFQKGAKVNYLANFITILSLVCGFVSMIFSLESQFTFASWAIILSVIFDGLDGQIARMNPVPSEFGKELDSLIDVVSFGIAPAILGYIFIYREFYLLGTIALFIYLLSSIMRLAKYNITPKGELKNYFYGLPTTMSGGVLASFILMFRKKEAELLPQPIPIIFVFVVITLSFLMVSRIKYFNLDAVKKILGRNTLLFLLFLTAILIIAAFFKKAGIALFTFFLIYLLFSPIVVKKIE